MISVQNRLPEPGKENRVSITPDNGSAVEGVLAYADDATQEGTFWNRKTAQLLQGDIRTYPVREGQSISAGDVVNVGREIVSGSEQTYGDLPVGLTIQINENDSPVDYLVVHQGNPDPELYDESCNGTWLLRKDISDKGIWNNSTPLSLLGSKIMSYMDSFDERFDEETRSKIKTVKIPYSEGYGSPPAINSGANGISCTAFPLSPREMFADFNATYSGNDGHVLDYFDGAENSKRIANYSGASEIYFTRAPETMGSSYTAIFSIEKNGDYSTRQQNTSRGYRPCYIFDSSALVGDAPVYGPETVYKDVVAQDNVENVMHTNAGNATGTSATKLNDLISVVSFKQGNGIRLMSFDNNAGTVNQEGYADVSMISNLLGYSVDRLDDSRLVVQMFGSTPYDEIYAKICTYNGSNISYGNQYTVLSSQPTSQTILGLSGALALSIYSSSGLKCKALPISGTTITTSGTEYPLSGNTGANYISACRLPDEGGNKRVCICFSDTGDGNKGKAVIATIDSSNVVTFGDVVTIWSASVDNTSCTTDGNVVMFSSEEGIAFTDTSLFLLKRDDTEILPAIVLNVGVSKFVRLTQTGIIRVVQYDNNEISKGEQYTINNGSQTLYASLALTSANSVIAAYADNGNSNYGTTTILTVEGNQIGGSFIDESKDAIALADGTGGQSIPVGFGGYCQCEGVTEGQQITSDGVSAFSPLDGWLKILYPLENDIVTGSFTADTTLQTIDLGFSPTCVLVYRGDTNNTNSSVANSQATGNAYNDVRIFTKEYISAEFGCITENGFSFLGKTSQQTHFVAWR